VRLKIAIVADDLTGALDSAAPFADRGLGVVAALDPGAVEPALAAVSADEAKALGEALKNVVG
jgi:uncharacterized protein YgbK (DUF1537 family)